MLNYILIKSISVEFLRQSHRQSSCSYKPMRLRICIQAIASRRIDSTFGIGMKRKVGMLLLAR